MSEFNIYIIELGKAVIEKRSFHEGFPGYNNGKPCVYVGQAALIDWPQESKHRGIHESSANGEPN